MNALRAQLEKLALILNELGGERVPARGKNINIFLIDGDPLKRIKCTLANWTGVAYKVPRTELEKCKERHEFQQSGVYFLFSSSEEEANKEVVYIGQAGLRNTGEGIYSRLKQHKSDENKSYWNEAVVLTTQNNSFGATEISYLENRFTNLAKVADRFVVKNGNEPNLGNVTEEKESELEEFIDYAKIVLGTLGYKVLEPLSKLYQVDGISATTGQERNLYLKSSNAGPNRSYDATARQTDEGFVVLKGSKFALEVLVKQEKLKIEAKRKSLNLTDGIFQEDVLFKSPNEAATIIYGGAINATISWKDSTGKTLKDIEKES